MDDTTAGDRPDDASRHWTSETLPLSVRKELLERELNKLGFRKAGAHAYDAPAPHQQSHAGSNHPQARDSGAGHGD